MTEKPKGWEDTVNDLIRANFDYRNTNLALKKKFGDVGAIGGDEYRQYKNKLSGGENVDEKIGNLGERKRVKQPKPKPAPVWDKKKQQVADTSKLAEIINMGLYQGMVPFCASRELEQKHVQEVNPGGAIVASLNYYFPEAKLEHPLVTLGIRVVILYIKFKAVCGKLQKTKDPAMSTAPMGQGLKPGMKTDKRT